MNHEIRFGVLGCGIIAPFHVEAINAVQGAAYRGACSKTRASAEKFCSKYGGILYENFAEMILDPEIDTVVICTPSGGHFDECKQALLAGKHVVVEKPMCMTLAQADTLIKLTKKTGRMLCAISQTRFSPAAQSLRKAIQNGDFGRLVSAALTMRYTRDQAYFDQAAWRGTIAGDGGMLMNQGLHGIDLLCSLMGTPVSVCGYARTLLRDVEIEDTVAAAVEFESGALATVDATLCSQPEFDRKIVLCGETGTAVLDGDRITFWSLPTPIPDFDTEREKYLKKDSGQAAIFSDHLLQYENLIAHLLHGTPLEVDAVQGRLPLAVILGIYESSRSGMKINIDNSSL